MGLQMPGGSAQHLLTATVVPVGEDLSALPGEDTVPAVPHPGVRLVPIGEQAHSDAALQEVLGIVASADGDSELGTELGAQRGLQDHLRERIGDRAEDVVADIGLKEHLARLSRVGPDPAELHESQRDGPAPGLLEDRLERIGRRASRIQLLDLVQREGEVLGLDHRPRLGEDQSVERQLDIAGAHHDHPELLTPHIDERAEESFP